MRVAIMTASLAALMLGAWTADAAAPIPPKCSASDTQRQRLLHTEVISSDGRYYFRACGPGRAVLQVAGKSFSIRGGTCSGPLGTVRFGLLGYGGLHGKGFSAHFPAEPPWHMHRRPGRNPIIDGDTQLPGFDSLPHQGTAFVSKDLDSATFYLGTPSQPRMITGSWTCG